LEKKEVKKSSLCLYVFFLKEFSFVFLGACVTTHSATGFVQGDSAAGVETSLARVIFPGGISIELQHLSTNGTGITICRPAYTNEAEGNRFVCFALFFRGFYRDD